MSRSIGDKAAKKLGVIDIPEMRLYEMSSVDKFVVIASDGVW